MKKYIFILSATFFTLAAALGFTMLSQPAFAAGSCSASLVVSDAAKYNTNSITVPKSCGSFTISLKHTGAGARSEKGHNVVITKTADLRAVALDGGAGGLGNHYIKPGDNRVIARSKIVGGGESTSVTFQPARLQAGGKYSFFSSFPGDVAVMKGRITVQ